MSLLRRKVNAFFFFPPSVSLSYRLRMLGCHLHLKVLGYKTGGPGNFDITMISNLPLIHTGFVQDLENLENWLDLAKSQGKPGIFTFLWKKVLRLVVLNQFYVINFCG